MRFRFELNLPWQAALIILAVAARAAAQTPALLPIDGDQIDAGGPPITKTLTGSGFVSGAVALWGTTPLPTTFISPAALQVTIPSSLTAISGKYSIVVKNPSGAASNAVPVYIQPVLLTVGPPLSAGIQSATIIATGIGFNPSDVLYLMIGFAQWPLQTTFVNSNRLTAVVPSGALAVSAQAPAFALDTGSATFSRQVLLTIGTPPVVNSISPATAVVDGAGFTLTVTGTGFLPGATVQWNGFGVPTVFSNSSRLLATIDTYLLRRSGSAPGLVPVSVINPDRGVSNALVCVVQESIPTISKLDPPSVFAGGPAFTLTVSGTGYVSRSKVSFNSVSLATQFISPTQLNAAVPASLTAGAGQAAVSILNEGALAGLGTISASFGFTIKPPVLDSTAPSSVKAGAPAFTLTANGAGYFPGHSIYWNGSPLATRYISTTQLSAVVDTGRVAVAGSASVTVVSAGGAVSNRIDFPINPGPPAISSLNPAGVPAGSAAFTLVVRGSNFTSGAVVQWNGAALPTTFAGTTELTATVPASMVARAVAATISVMTSAGLSNPLPFTVTAPLPAIDTGGVMNSFSGRPMIAPGCLVTIYGANLAGRAVAAEGYPLPPALGGTSVTINGRTAPLLYASPSQLNVQAPFEIAPGAGSLVIDANGAQSAAIPITVAEVAPGTLTMPQSNHALAVNYPAWTLNSAENPALPGDYVIAYITGQGRLDKAMTTGEAAPDTPFFLPAAPVEAKVGGRPAEIGFAGLAPGIAGVLQLNLKLPDVGPGEQIFEVSIGNLPSNTTVLSVGESQPK